MRNPNRLQIAALKLERPPTGISFAAHRGLLHAYDGRTIYIWESPKFDQEWRYSISDSERSREGHCRFLNDGRKVMLIASADDSENGIHHVSVRDLVSHTLDFQADIRVEHYGVLGLVFNNTSNQWLFTDCGGTSHFVEFASCIRTHSIELDTSAFGPRGSSKSLIFSPDDIELWGTCGHDEPGGYREYLAAFDPTTGKGIRRQPPHQGNHIDRIQLSPDSSFLLAVEEKALCFRDPRSWKLVGTVDLESALRKGWGRSQPALAFTADSRYVAASCEYNQKVCIAECQTGRLIGVFDVDDEFCIRLLSFSSDSRYLAIASYDVQNEIRVWDVSAILLKQKPRREGSAS